MILYHIICTATLLEAAPAVDIVASCKTPREAEECFAHTMELYVNDDRYDWDLNDDTFIAHSHFSDIKYYYEIHTSEVN